ncbi:MAG: rhodanese-like domain-containing protein [Desulfobulbaceae bacterium]|nr:rhodanese-like domain-containing protein [Desulfobulbaceae bacterium]
MNRRPLGFIMYILLAALAGFALSTPSAANAAPLVTTDWMAKNLNAKGLVLIDVRTDNNYAVGHLPGAVSLPYGQWEPMNEDADCNLMPSPAKMTELLKTLGVNASSHVVIYDHGNTTSDTTKGTSAVWIMTAMGHKNVSYLNGGFTKWTFEGRIIDNVKPTPAPGNFVAKLDDSKVATLQEVKDSIKNKSAILLDVRNSDQHFGFKKRADVERFGHITGSLSWPADFMTHGGINRAPAYVLDKKDLKTMAKGVGLPTSWSKKENIIVYCNSSQFAGLGYFVLHDILGYKNVSVYDGSMLEFASDEDLPMTSFSWGFVTK